MSWTSLGNEVKAHTLRVLPAMVAWGVCFAAIVLFLSTRGLPHRTQNAIQGGSDKPLSVTYSLWPRPDLTPPKLYVNVEIPVPAGDTAVTVQMPSWSPGDYHLQNHGSFVQEFRAAALSGSQQTHSLPVHHPDTGTWQIETQGAPNLLVSYALPQTPPGIFSDNVTLAQHYAFINGPSAFVYVMGHKDWKVDLHIYAPPNWSAETALPRMEVAAHPNATGFSAPDYDMLADSPLVAADRQAMTTRDFEVDHVQHRAVFFHDPTNPQAADAFVPMLKRVAQAENDIMGGPPYSRYDFLFDVGGGGGGLEHLNSARILLWPGADPDSMQSFVAHEFFHLWNVKRIRPAVLGPFDYVHPPKTRNLWFAEGVTEYYAHIAVRRAGLVGAADFYRHWQRAIAGLQANPARKRVSADEASLRVWESGNSQGYGGLSYYDKGEMIGLCLDLKIRHVTNNAKSLDDVMRLLLKRHLPPKPGYGEDELRSTVSEVAGQDLSSFYDLLARSTAELPFVACLGYAGLDTSLRPLANADAGQVALRQSWSAEGPSAPVTANDR